MGVKDRKADFESGMAETLRRLQAAVEGELSCDKGPMTRTEQGG